MGLYINLNDVKIRLRGKVAFDDNNVDENKMGSLTANQLIAQAEADVELDLSPRYAAPFQTDAGQPFSALPMRPTRQAIKTLCLNKAVLYILATDFGSGTAVDGEQYGKMLNSQYLSIIKRLLEERDDGSYRQWKYPPLPGLMLAPHNAASDDGFSGQIFVTGSGEGAYAAESVNDPGKTFWNATEADLVDPDAGGNLFDPNL